MQPQLPFHLMQPEPNTGCWLWTGYVQPPGGYGKVRIEGHSRLAHRVAWAKANGPIPVGYELHHKCGVPSCVNPDHLQLTRRLEHPGHPTALNAAKTVCPHCGQPYSKNTYQRFCRTLKNERRRVTNRVRVEKAHASA